MIHALRRFDPSVEVLRSLNRHLAPYSFVVVSMAFEATSVGVVGHQAAERGFPLG